MKHARIHDAKDAIHIGTRMTKARKEILNLIAQTRAPFTIRDIASRASVDEASVYRTVRILKEEGYLATLDYPDGTRRYEVAHEHHHHLVCTSCGYTEHLHADSEPSTPTTKGTRFRHITGHEVTYYGVCTKCS